MMIKLTEEQLKLIREDKIIWMGDNKLEICKNCNRVIKFSKKFFLREMHRC